MVLDYYEYIPQVDGSRPSTTILWITTEFHQAMLRKEAYLDWKPGSPLPPFLTMVNGVPVQTSETFNGNYGDYDHSFPIDLSLWDMSQVKDASRMFAGNICFADLDMSMLDLRNLEDIEAMFAHSSARTLDLSNQTLSKVKCANRFLRECGFLEYLDISACENPIILNEIAATEFRALKRIFVKNEAVKSQIEKVRMLKRLEDLKYNGAETVQKILQKDGPKIIPVY